jgi:sulfhydrogenase subunit alpha
VNGDLLTARIDRVGGRAGFEVGMSDGKPRATLIVEETPRFFEELVVGRRVAEVPALVSRICGRCSGGQRLAAILSLEEALGVRVGRQTKLRRELLVHGLFIESHVRHFYYLALPDYHGSADAERLRRELPDEMAAADAVIALGRRIQEFAGGRRVHPVTPEIGGFSSIGPPEELTRIGWMAQRHLRDAEDMVATAARLSYPRIGETPAGLRALRPKGKTYGYLGHTVISTPGGQCTMEAQVNAFRELPAPRSTVSCLSSDGPPRMVGPAARIGLAHARLTSRAREALRRSGWKPLCANPFFQHVARMVEVVYSLERLGWVTEQLLDGGPPERQAEIPSLRRRRRGVGGLELPQGTCYHDYEVGEDGRVVRARIHPPSPQNLAHLDGSLPAAQTRPALEMLVRSYDLCLTCAVR